MALLKENDELILIPSVWEYGSASVEGFSWCCSLAGSNANFGSVP